MVDGKARRAVVALPGVSKVVGATLFQLSALANAFLGEMEAAAEPAVVRPQHDRPE